MVKAKKYPKKKLTVFKKLLTERRSALLKQVTDQAEDIGGLRDDQPADPLDMAGHSSTLELMTALGNHERVELIEIDHALSKIEEGTYGICDRSVYDRSPGEAGEDHTRSGRAAEAPYDSQR